MRLIDADELIVNFEWCKQQAGRFNENHWNDVIRRVNEQETVDAEPVRHGRWKAIKVGGSGYPFWDNKCSECGYTTSRAMNGWVYCPHCGAKVDGGDADADSTS